MPKQDYESIHTYNENLLVNIRRYCREQNMSITKIEQALGYGNGTVSGWTKARRRAPYERVAAIAKLLNVPVFALTGLSGQPANETVSGLSEDELEIIQMLRSVQKPFQVSAYTAVKSVLQALPVLDADEGDQ